MCKLSGFTGTWHDKTVGKKIKIDLADMDLDEYINLKNRVEMRMKISVMTSTGDDDLLNAEEKGNLEYRRAQLKRLQEEVVDIGTDEENRVGTKCRNCPRCKWKIDYNDKGNFI